MKWNSTLLPNHEKYLALFDSSIDGDCASVNANANANVDDCFIIIIFFIFLNCSKSGPF